MIVWDNSSLLVDLTHSRTASPTSFSLPNLARRMAVFCVEKISSRLETMFSREEYFTPSILAFFWLDILGRRSYLLMMSCFSRME